VEGEYTEEGVLEIIAIGLPPCESREMARFETSLYPCIIFDCGIGQYMVTLTS
jgi:hypothetical protein